MNTNPYDPPVSTEPPLKITAPTVLAICVLFSVRISLSACVAFILARCVTHQPFHVGNVTVLLVLVSLVLLLTHLVESRKTTNQVASRKIALIGYTAGSGTMFIVYALDRFFPWFGQFTEL